jgi:multidrug efflux system membrane fusion protein
LQPGEQIVTDGQYRIQAGSKVEAAAQAASAADIGRENSP